MGPFSTQEGITTWEESSQFSPHLHLTFCSSRVCLNGLQPGQYTYDWKIISPLLTLKLVHSYVKICWNYSNPTTHSPPLAQSPRLLPSVHLDYYMIPWSIFVSFDHPCPKSRIFVTFMSCLLNAHFSLKLIMDTQTVCLSVGSSANKKRENVAGPWPGGRIIT